MLQRRDKLKLLVSGTSIQIEYLYVLPDSSSFIFFQESFILWLILCVWYVVQVIVERAEKSDVPDIDKKKYVSFFSKFLIS